ncbi:hypothetical protein [Methylobacterium isbiliense]|jgi:hypothetical protein|uniref:Secreted protein n=1 Tax=Methylobacterium isbiliense TaxID=315478 RepID=A0ABQ4SER3_9HYPH|nr:hypothetical protein [Methylobacterium isbiliense]MDN3624455.1 hypothetical protein [Methylobacterium isbiliense]GJE01665.1 hypothetical protein GMJLKIPL_3599 [Methylobacterium isbiliense]
MVRFVTGALVSVSLLVAAGAAEAAPFGFCKSYANDAAKQYQRMRSTPSCARPPSNFWHPDRQLHLDWCLTAPVLAVNAERYKRDDVLANCDTGLGG